MSGCGPGKGGPKSKGGRRGGTVIAGTGTRFPVPDVGDVGVGAGKAE